MIMNKVLSRFRFAAIFFLILAVPTFAQQEPADLMQSCDPALQKGLERCLIDLKLNQAAKRKNLRMTPNLCSSGWWLSNWR